MLRWLTAVSIAAVPIALPAAAAAQDHGRGFGGASTIRCESWEYRTAVCPVDLGPRGEVRLVRTVAGNCVEGQTWRSDRRGVIVSGGCRAVFAVSSGFDPGDGPGYPGGRETVACQSFKYRYQQCDLPGGGRPRLINVIAGDCVEGRSWGGARGAVWVNHGCRAVFTSGRGGGWNGGNAQLVLCESYKYRYAECPAPGRRVEIDRVVAGNCVQGSSWGQGPRGIWVDKGCRARFRVFG